MQKIKVTHSAALKRAGLPTLETLTRRVLRQFDSATPAMIESGARWYDDAHALAVTLAATHGPSIEYVAAIISHLSPRTSWSRNIAGATAFLQSGPDGARELGCISTNIDRASRVTDGSPLTSFGPGALKTRSFAANIAGDREAVTVDIWAIRAVGVDESELSRVGIYDAVAHAYRLAAARRGVDPATMQATVWVVIRNGRAS